jgi:hypothetical protein
MPLPRSARWRAARTIARGFNRWIKAHRRASVPGVDLRPKEVAALLRLARLKAA